MRDQVAKLSSQVGQPSNENSTADEAAADSGSEESSEGSDGDDDVFDLPLEEVKKNAAKRGPRASVSAEAFGNWNKKEEFKAPFYPKSDELISALRTRLSQAFMFSNLNPDELEIVLGAMQKVSFQAGETVIKQGDDGDNLYVVETGKLACSKRFQPDAEPVHLKDYVPGEAFGELALLYNAARAASISASEPSELWALDRRTFNHIVKDSA